MDNNKILDEFARSYYEKLAKDAYADPVNITPKDTALIIIDAQNCLKKEYLIEEYHAMGNYS